MYLSAGQMAMDDDDGAPRCSTGGLSALSHKLTRKFRPASADNGNLVFSPLSIYSALSLAAAGAEGRTLSELLGVLGAESREDLAENVRCMVDRALPDAGENEKQKPGGGGGGPRVAHSCGLWHDAARTLKPAYRDVAAASCSAVARAVDFLNKPEEARKEINRWVASATNKLIESILPQGSVRQNTGLVVATAIYFKGMWATPFDASRTKEGKFHRLDGTTVDAQFMRSRRDQYIATYRGFKVLRMPYAAAAVHDDPLVELEWMRAAGKTTPPPGAAMPPPPPRAMPGPRYSMLVLLPDKRDGLAALEDKLLAASSSHAFLDRHTPEDRVEVGDFRVPRFKLSFFTNSSGALQELGARAVFDHKVAQLPNILEDNGGTRRLYIGDVYHKAVIEVNEQGTEAAGATAISIRCGDAPGSRPWRPKPVDFVADHPFAFFVVEDGSGAILFAGHVHDPTKT